MHRSVEVAQHRPTQAEVLDHTGDPGDAHHVALVVLVLEHHEDARQPVADQRLGPESDGDAHDSEARDGRTDVDVEAGRERHEHRHDHDHHAAGSHRGSLDRPHPALQLNLGQDRVGFLRFAAQPGGEVRIELVVAKHEPRAEPADVAIGDIRSVV